MDFSSYLYTSIDCNIHKSQDVETPLSHQQVKRNKTWYIQAMDCYSDPGKDWISDTLHNVDEMWSYLE